jgi:glycine hydroxymethyltransferase
MHVIAAKAVAFKEALRPEFKTYQQQILNNARVMAKTIMQRGYKIVSNGTDDHLMLIDLIEKKITGRDAENALGQAYITTNKNAVPNDPQSPFITSGLRIGTPAVTTRGFKEKECEQVANWICDILDDLQDTAKIASIKEKVVALCKQFPVYSSRSSFVDA